ncbi:hypothetical protein ACHAXH_002131 [Discostella pseudostelligera]
MVDKYFFASLSSLNRESTVKSLICSVIVSPTIFQVFMCPQFWIWFNIIMLRCSAFIHFLPRCIDQIPLLAGEAPHRLPLYLQPIETIHDICTGHDFLNFGTNL